MKSFLRSSVMFLLGMALAFSGFCTGIVQVARQRVVETIRWAKDTFKYVVDRMLAKLHTGRMLNGPAVLLIVSKAFVLRKIRREAPRIENSWRLCPST
jgi:hypothetical protein